MVEVLFRTFSSITGQMMELKKFRLISIVVEILILVVLPIN